MQRLSLTVFTSVPEYFFIPSKKRRFIYENVRVRYAIEYLNTCMHNRSAYNKGEQLCTHDLFDAHLHTTLLTKIN